MTIDVDAPPIIDQLSTQLTACPSWTGTNWYQNVNLKTTALPVATLAELDSDNDSVAAATNTWSGTLEIIIFSESTVAQLESLGRNIQSELLVQSPGIPFRSINVGLAQDATPSDTATGSTYRAIIITIDYGLGA